MGDVLRLEQEQTNSNDRFAVAVMDAGSRVVGHIANFPKTSMHKETVEVMGQGVNQGIGYDLQIPYTYRL